MIRGGPDRAPRRCRVGQASGSLTTSAVSTGSYDATSLIDQLNKIRILTGAELASETDFFVVRLDHGLKAFARNTEVKLDAAALARLQAIFRKILPALLAGEASAELLGRLQQIFKALHQLSGRPVPAAIGYAQESGIPFETASSAPGRGNVWARLEGRGNAPALILLHHMDVVPATAEEWSVPPLSGTLGITGGPGTKVSAVICTAYPLVTP